MPFPQRSTWLLESNGFPLGLEVFQVDDAGNIDGILITSDSRLPLEEAVFGEDTRQLRFKVTLTNGEIQTYQGFLFDRVVTIDQITYAAAMAGTFTGDRFEDPRRPGFGWFALRGPLLK
jgi:hypothetical protein